METIGKVGFASDSQLFVWGPKALDSWGFEVRAQGLGFRLSFSAKTRPKQYLFGVHT